MASLGLGSLLVLCLLVFGSAGEGEWQAFKAWQAEYGKRYPSESEEKMKFEIFIENTKLVASLNREYKERNIKFIVNMFGDMSSEEFKQTILMKPSPAPPTHKDHMTEITEEAPPATFDWRTRNVVSPVKDQGSAGSCWAFSTVGNIEGQWALRIGKVLSLSAELLVDCDGSKDIPNHRADCGVFGGWPYLAYDFLKHLGGIETDTDYPYCSGTGGCYPCPPPGYNSSLCGPPTPYCNVTQSCSAKLNKNLFVNGLQIGTWVRIPKNETAMLYESYTRGPLSVLMNADFLQFYHSGVWNPFFKCDPTSLDHAVLLVGWGTDKGFLHDKPYWLIKNSWGTKWGEDGYFKLIRGKGECGIDQQVTSVVLE